MELVENKKKLLVVKCLLVNKMLNSNQLSKKIGKAQSTAYEHLEDLKKQKYVFKDQNKKYYLNEDKVKQEILAKIDSLKKEIEYYNDIIHYKTK